MLSPLEAGSPATLGLALALHCNQHVSSASRLNASRFIKSSRFQSEQGEPDSL